jgi:ABC-type Mn2+/Zn2+ transport system ATPase subunit
MPGAEKAGRRRVVFEQVTLGYRGAPVLSRVNLELHAGEMVGIIGRSGAGKSTLIAALCGGDVVIDGSVTIDGLNPKRLRQPVGFVPQLNNETLSRLSVVELVALGKPRIGLFTSRRERMEATVLLERLGLEGLGERRLDQLSGGQRQRVAIARALTASDTLLLCDEPTSGADPVLTSEISNVLAEVAGKGTTVVVATHDLAMVAPRLDRLIGIANGEVIFDDTPAMFTPEQQVAVYGAGILDGTRQ